MDAKHLKILYITQKVDQNDDLLGPIYYWLENLAGKINKLFVICLAKGENRLPENTQVFSLGKESGQNDFKYLFKFYLLCLPLIFGYKIDGIFIHMNQVYVYLLLPLWPVLKILNIPVILWKAHGNLNLSAKLARFFVDKVVTSVAVAYNINTPKRKIIGQGIDTQKFKPLLGQSLASSEIKIGVIGRVSAVRRYDLLLQAISQVAKELPDVKLKVSVFGDAIEGHVSDYFDNIIKLRDQLNLNGIVEFCGRKRNFELPALINQQDFLVNPGGSNSLDKAIVETMSCAKIMVDSNAASWEILQASDLSEAEKGLFLFKRGDATDLAEKIKHVINLSVEQRQTIGNRLRDLVVKNHDVNHLNEQIIETFITCHSDRA